MGRALSLYGGIEVPGRPDLNNVRKLDLLPLPALRRMQLYGFCIDAPYFHDLSHDFGNQLIDKRRAISSYIPPDKLEQFVEVSGTYDDDFDDMDVNINPDSGQQLSTLLFDVLGIGKGVKLKTTKGGDRLATDKKQLEMLKRDNPIIGEILEYRQIAKLKGTYTDKLPRISRLHPRGADCPHCGLYHAAETLRVHTQIMGTRTTTWRYASKNPNLSNIPTRTKQGALVRAGFIASPGKKLVQRDWSQIELRELAHFSADDNLIRIYLEDGDVHLDTACRAFNLTADQVDKILHRAPCKNVNFGICYGLTDSGLYDQMLLTYATAGVAIPTWLTQTWCKVFIDNWFSLYPGVKAYMDQEQYRAQRYGCVWNIFGFARHVPEIRSVHKRIQAAGLRQAGNMKIQSTNAGLMKLGIAEVGERLEDLERATGQYAALLMTIYDELITECDEDLADVVDCVMEEVMDNVTVDKQTGRNIFLVPVKSEGRLLDRWEK